LEEPLPGATERFRISGKNGPEFPEPTAAGRKKEMARSDYYISHPHSPTGKDAPTSLVNLELETSKRA
jgi:hypothetical protein